MPNKFTFREGREAGEEFIEFLRASGRLGVSDRESLRTIYNEEFKHRDNERRSGFSHMLYTLRGCSRAVVSKYSVQLGTVKKKVKFTNQYWRTADNAGDQMPFGSNSAAGPPRRSRAKDRAEFISKKNGVDIVSEHDLSNGRIRFHVPLREAKTITIRIKNGGAYDVTLCKYRILRRSREFTFEVSQCLPVTLPPGASWEISVCCLTRFYGYFLTIMLFEFTIDQTTELFTIGRFVSAVCNSKLAEELGPSAPYRPYEADLRKPQFVTTVEGRLPKDSVPYELERIIPLEDYRYPPSLKDLVKYFEEGRPPSDGSRKMVDKYRSNLKAPLQFNNYCDKFRLLLYLEEIQMEVDIHRYDMQNVVMEVDQTNKSLLILKVPGVAENRPSVLRGDHLFVTLADQRGQNPVVRYQGYVHAVELEKVKLGFSEKLICQFINNMKFDVTFTFNRLPLRVQHRAVALAEERQLKDLLFPSFSYQESLLSAGSRLSFFDRNLEKNEQQSKAVYQVVAGTSRPAPYLIFGPPGTGKTVTIVEAIKQVLRHFEGSHVLACAPSNSASDLLCQHLLNHVDKKRIYRMNAFSRDYRSVPEDIKPCCNWDNVGKCFVFPSKEALKNYRVIITTLLTAGRLASADFPRGHFSHVFIDECGHAVEPESLVAIAGILDLKTNAGGQLVLTGDPQQLGPILRSPLAIKHGLELSLLERLMHHNPLYEKKDGSYNPQFVTKLLQNYRSHPAILKFPNDKFYDGELQVHANPIIANSYCSWSGLVKQGFPIIFHGVCGEDQREEKSPSFFNTAEIAVLIDYLEKLLREQQGKKGLSRISPKDTGVISPYRKQVEKIRTAINKSPLKDLPDIKELKVGSVEEFQGQERRVVLISTVRSCSEYLHIDEKFNLGFLKNPKRFNVAITRPKALLIVIGNPSVLKQDPVWGEFLKYCRTNGAYQGYPYEEEENEVDEDLAAEVRFLSLNGEPAGHNLGESHIQQQVEPAWRHEH